MVLMAARNTSSMNGGRGRAHANSGDHKRHATGIVLYADLDNSFVD